jgi:hypothetical protein
MSPQRDEKLAENVRPSVRLIHAIPIIPLFLVALIAAGEIRDNSFLWHVRAGAEQLARERVLSLDPFSFTTVGVPWRTQSWLMELVYANAERVWDGLAWANIMVFVLGCVTAGLIGLSIYRGVRSPVATGFAMIVTVWLGGPFLQPRPVLASYLLLAALVVVLQNRDRILWIAVPIIWIWAGVHGTWILGGALLFLEWLRTSDVRVFKAGIAALVSTVLTAHGLGVWQILIDFASARDALALMEEWAVPDFGNIVQAPYLILIAGVIVAGVRGRLKPKDLIVILPFLFFGMTSRRAIFPAAIVLAPWAALAIPPMRVPASSLSTRMAGVVVATIALATLVPLASMPLGVLDERFPTPEIQAAIRDLDPFHDAAVGGFLIYAEWPERLVYLDDRAELYGAERLLEYGAATDGQYEEVFARYGFNAALTRNEWPLRDVLEEDGWRVVAEDETFTVLVSE